jgi:RNA polymerase sigma-70 factor, ECF subfamily
VEDLRPAFATFFEEHYESVCRGLTVAFGDARLAEEAAQEAFTRAYVRWRRVSKMERPAGWVYVTAVRYARHRRKSPPDELKPHVEADIAELVVRRATLEAALGLLGERQRLAVVLRYGLDLSLQQVASAMGCTVGTAKSTLHTSLARLTVVLDESTSEVERDQRR